MRNQSWKPKAGEFVVVRSRDEILATLDQSGRLDGLPFMPQMFKYCGQRLRVLSRAHKTCDVIGGKARAFPNGVHLETRCDGEAYGGCQANCLLFWNIDWVKPCLYSSVGYQRPQNETSKVTNAGNIAVAVCTEADIMRATKAECGSESGAVVYTCQATCVTAFTRPLAWWNLKQYLEDYSSGNASLGRLFRGMIYQVYQHTTQAWRDKLGMPARWVYDVFQRMKGGIPFPRKPGKLPDGATAPRIDLNLQPGEIVRVKSHQEILLTIHKDGMNRGLLFDKEMVPFCGRIVRVKERVSTFVDERTGELRKLKTSAIILEGVWCQSRYSNNKMFCPRSIHPWWREIWLERVSDADLVSSESQDCPLQTRIGSDSLGLRRRRH